MYGPSDEPRLSPVSTVFLLPDERGKPVDERGPVPRRLGGQRGHIDLGLSRGLSGVLYGPPDE